MAKLKVVHYINQFFAQIGGEEKADYPVELFSTNLCKELIDVMNNF